MKVARTGSADFKPNTNHKAGIFLLPVLGSIACTIETEIEFAHFILISRFPVLDGNLYEHGSAGLCVEIGPLNVRAEDAIAALLSLVAGTLAYDATQALQRRSCCKEIWAFVRFDFPSHQPSSVVGVVCIALVNVQPSGGDDFGAARL